jgi:hypothetical protein
MGLAEVFGRKKSRRVNIFTKGKGNLNVPKNDVGKNKTYDVKLHYGRC